MAAVVLKATTGKQVIEVALDLAEGAVLPLQHPGK